MATFDIARIRNMQTDAEIAADAAGIYHTPVTWVRCTDNVLRLLPVFNSWGQRIVRLT